MIARSTSPLREPAPMHKTVLCPVTDSTTFSSAREALMDVNIRKLRARADVCLSLKYRAESLLVEAHLSPDWLANCSVMFDNLLNLWNRTGLRSMPGVLEA